MAQYFFDLLYNFTDCMCCFPSTPQLKINNRSFKLLRLLGEGGFSYVYLVQDKTTSELFALKKIRCPFGQESVSQALKEVEAYSLFTSTDNIIHAIDHCVSTESGSKFRSDGGEPGSKTVYILLPYYQRGNLQDAINANLVNHTRFPEKRLMMLMLGVAKALKAMHQYRVQSGSASTRKAKGVRREGEEADEERTMQMKPKRRASHRADDEDEENEPLMDDEVTRSQEGVQEGGLRPYAHRDIKPGNIMIDDDGQTPILMDLGSLAPSPIAITSRSLALAVQDTAAEHSTMPYRAPELFDVKTGSIIDTKVDIWSLGCTLYACLVGKSPFEARSDETGGSLSMCVLGGDWRFPDEKTTATKGKGKVGADTENASGSSEQVISTPVKEVVRKCLQVEAAERPDIDELIQIMQDVISELPDDDVLLAGFIHGELAATTAEALSHGGAGCIIFTGRSQSEVQPAINHLNRKYPRTKILFVTADTSSLSNMREAARTIKGLGVPIDGIVCYPTIMAADWQKTADGIESHFQNNYLAYFVLVNALLEVMLPGSRVVLMTTSIRREAPAPRWEDINFANGERYHSLDGYSQSMFANILFAKSLAQICAEKGVVAFSANPGNTTTNVQTYLSAEEVASWLQRKKEAGEDLPILLQQAPKSLSQASATIIRGLLDPMLAEQSGAFLDNCEVLTLPYLDFPNGEESATSLWKQSEVYVEAAGLTQVV
ncbi:serine/threonine-protein kinase env7 [Penicillium ochrochloron]